LFAAPVEAQRSPAGKREIGASAQFRGGVIAHNHPSGVASPSQLPTIHYGSCSRSAGAVDIRLLLDHIIVATGRAYRWRNGG